jgi:uncharacterized protein YjbJ (UPF0337 family)
MEARSLQDNWNNVRDRVKDWWNELTDDDLNTIDGDPNQLVPTLQERYGYTRELAEAEVDKRMTSYNESGMQNQRGGSPSQGNQGNQSNRGSNQQNQNQRESSPSQGNQGDQAHRGNRSDTGSASRNQNNEGNNQGR